MKLFAIDPNLKPEDRTVDNYYYPALLAIHGLSLFLLEAAHDVKWNNASADYLEVVLLAQQKTTEYMEEIEGFMRNSLKPALSVVA